MKDLIKNIAVIFGPYLYFLGFIIIFLGYEEIGIVFLIVGIICYLFARIYCIYHVVKNRTEYKDKWILHLLLLLMFSPFYIPIYYIHCIMKKNLGLGIAAAALYPILIVAMVVVLFVTGIKSGDFNDYKTVTTKDELISLDVPKNYQCKTTLIKDASLLCTEYYDDSYLELYNYENEEDYSEIFDEIYEKKLFEYKNKRNVQIINENKKESYATLNIIENNITYVMTIELKELDENIATIVVFYDYSNSSYYNDIFSSIKIATKFNTL